MGKEPLHQDWTAGQLHTRRLLPGRHPEEQEREGAHLLRVPGGGMPGQHAAVRCIHLRRRLRVLGTEIAPKEYFPRVDETLQQ